MAWTESGIATVSSARDVSIMLLKGPSILISTVISFNAAGLHKASLVQLDSER